MKTQAGECQIGFIPASDGWHNAVIDQNIKYYVKKNEETETEEETNSLVIPLKVIEDEDEGKTIFYWCDLGSKGGKYAFAECLHKSKLSKKIAEKKKWCELCDDDADKDWKDEYFTKDSKLVNQSIVQLPGRFVKCNCKATTKVVNGKNRTNVNVIGLDFYRKSESRLVEEPPSEEVETNDF